MITHAWNWAREHGQLRVNPIHGEEEIRIVLEDFFENVNQQGTAMEQTGRFDMEAWRLRRTHFCREDPDGSLFQDHAVPEGLEGLVPEIDGSGVVHNLPGSFKYLSLRICICHLRIVFPSLQQNVCLMQVLPTWIETLGRKIDSAETEKAPTQPWSTCPSAGEAGGQEAGKGHCDACHVFRKSDPHQDRPADWRLPE